MGGKGTDGFLHVDGDIEAGYTRDIDLDGKIFFPVYCWKGWSRELYHMLDYRLFEKKNGQENKRRF